MGVNYHSITDMVQFDGAINIQNTDLVFDIKYSRITVIYSTEHIV